jgi:hypothetical protein
MTDKEIDAAMPALIGWFESQDISPSEAGLVMVNLMAAQFVLKSHDADQLQEAIDLSTALLATEIAGFLASTNSKP